MSPKTPAFILTGATGFVGSALAAQAMAAGIRVVALSRSDPGGARTTSAVQRAADGMQLSQRSQPLQVFELSQTGLQAAASALGDFDVSLWHCAAEMSYSYRQMQSSLTFNVSGSVELLQWAHELRIARFIYVSTAFSTNQTGRIEEQIHHTTSPSNAYQASKWLAETLLSHRARELGQALTILRPGVIIGHSQTGWSSGKPFGAFMFLAAMHKLAAMGIDRVHLDIVPETTAQLLTIDQFTEWSLAIAAQPQRDLEIIHMVNKDLTQCTMAAVGASYSTHSGVCMSFGPPSTLADALFDRQVRKNKEFAGRAWDFSDDALRRFGIDNRAITRAQVDRSMAYFSSLERSEAKRSRAYSALLRSKSMPKTDRVLKLVSRIGRLSARRSAEV
jgi:nucleoside-diphosphate-sugar epimerase